MFQLREEILTLQPLDSCRFVKNCPGKLSSIPSVLRIVDGLVDESHAVIKLPDSIGSPLVAF